MLLRKDDSPERSLISIEVDLVHVALHACTWLCTI